MKHVLIRLIKDVRGAAAIEFFIVFPIFLFITFFLMELCLIGFSSITIENAMAEATRLGKIGVTEGGLNRNDYIREQIRVRSYGLVLPDRLAITSTVVPNAGLPNYDAITTDDFCVDDFRPVGNCPCAPGTTFIDNNGDGVCTPPGGGAAMDVGNPGDVVRYTATYRWRVLTPLIPLGELVADAGLAMGDVNGDLMIISGGAVRNE
jgi:hypothetical protein